MHLGKAGQEIALGSKIRGPSDMSVNSFEKQMDKSIGSLRNHLKSPGNNSDIQGGLVGKRRDRKEKDRKKNNQSAPFNPKNPMP